ncbi:MAG: glucokinase [Alteromonadaceae bacterium]|jgi:glucokinase
MLDSSIAALDIGGTKITSGRYSFSCLNDGVMEAVETLPFCAQGSAKEILAFIITCIDKIKLDNMVAIAIGVPSIVDVEQGIIYETINIQSWQEVSLKKDLEAHFNLPVYINNDVNCFTVGEHLNGAGQGYKDIVGICLGTGFGAGIVSNNQLYAGHNCGAGEVGCINYLDATIDDYCSGQFFVKHYQESGADLAAKARNGDTHANAAFQAFGKHLANAITPILLMLDPQLIVIGGSVAQSFDLFIDALWQELNGFPLKRVIDNLNIVPSQKSDSALLGAAHLYLTSINKA